MRWGDVVKHLYCALLLSSFVLMLSVLRFYSSDVGIEAISPSFAQEIIVIDAGHGGEDGGAVSISGALESEINLAIALRLEQILALYGRRSVMLRSEDISLHDDGVDTVRGRKSSDLRNRVSMIAAVNNALFVSIHQNSFPQEKYHGAQVFYAKTDSSQALGTHMQAALRQWLDPANEREAKPIQDTLYLMNHITCPGILVECGFLTNQTESAQLQTEIYQQKVAAAIAAGLLSYQT